MAAQVQAMTIKVPHLLSVFFFFVKNELRFKIEVVCEVEMFIDNGETVLQRLQQQIRQTKSKQPPMRTTKAKTLLVRGGFL